ncbi:MAG: hypothetical protein RL160_387 [Bacteroidota bacterium]
MNHAIGLFILVLAVYSSSGNKISLIQSFSFDEVLVCTHMRILIQAAAYMNEVKTQAKREKKKATWNLYGQGTVIFLISRGIMALLLSGYQQKRAAELVQQGNSRSICIHAA